MYAQSYAHFAPVTSSIEATTIIAVRACRRPRVRSEGIAIHDAEQSPDIVGDAISTHYVSAGEVRDAMDGGVPMHPVITLRKRSLGLSGCGASVPAPV